MRISTNFNDIVPVSIDLGATLAATLASMITKLTFLIGVVSATAQIASPSTLLTMTTATCASPTSPLVTASSTANPGTSTAICSSHSGPVESTASASASYGHLTANGGFVSSTGVFSFNSQSSYSDSLVLFGGSGIARFIMTLTAFAGEDGPFGNTTAVLQFNDQNVGTLRQDAFRFPVASSVQTLIVDKPFSAGQSFNFGSTLVSQGYYNNLLRIESDLNLEIQLLSESLTPLTGLQYVSESGATYRISGASAAAVPQPSSLTMTLLGIVVAMGGSRLLRSKRTGTLLRSAITGNKTD